MAKGQPKDGSKKVFLTPEQKEKQIVAAKKIGELTEQIAALLPEFEGKSVHQAFENSVINLRKKVEQYSTVSERFQTSAEEREILLKLREGKLIIKEKKA